MRQSLSSLLLRSGHDVIAVSDGTELVDVCQSQTIDLIITDIFMPKMDGLEAVETIYKHRPVPVVIVSGTPASDFLDRAQGIHAYGCLVKPINEADIIPAIELAMGRFEENQVLLHERETLRQSLADRKLVERAKGVLMRQTGLDEAAAFQRLQIIARNKRRKLVEIAEMILTAQEAVSS